MKVEGLEFDGADMAEADLIRMCILTIGVMNMRKPTQEELAHIAQGILDAVDPMVDGEPEGDKKPELRDDVWHAAFNMASQG